LTPEKKLLVAKQLDALGVDIIEAGFAAASEGEMEAIKLITKEGLRAEVCSFARGVKGDIDAVLESGVNSVFLVIPESDIHIKNKLKKLREDMLKLTEECVQYAKDHGLMVEFGPEDATKTDFQSKLANCSAFSGLEVFING